MSNGAEYKGDYLSTLPNAGAFVTVMGYRTKKQAPTPPKDPNEYSYAGEYANWGDDNLEPQRILEKLEKSTIALSTIYRLIQLIYGQGIVYYKPEYDDEGNLIVKPLKIPEIERFLKRNKVKTRYLVSRIMDFRFFNNMFSEFILSRDKQKIARVLHKETSFSRLAKQDEKKLRIPFVGYSAAWELGREDYIAKIPLADEYDPLWWIENKLKGFKFSTWSYFPFPGKIYYKPSYAQGLFREDGWLDVANDIPEIIRAMHKNQIKFRYHIKIPYEYWTMMYKDWMNYSDAKRKELMSKKFEEMDEYLKGKENSAKTFISHFGTSPMTGKPLPGWEIIAIDDKFKEDAYIPNSKAADSQITQTLGLDSSLAGHQTEGGKLGAGSGSDKRVGIVNMITLNTIEQNIILEDLDLISEFNRWDVEWCFKHNIPTRLDQNPEGQEMV